MNRDEKFKTSKTRTFLMEFKTMLCGFSFKRFNDYNINDKYIKTLVTLININNAKRTFARSNVYAYFTFEYIRK